MGNRSSALCPARCRASLSTIIQELLEIFRQEVERKRPDRNTVKLCKKCTKPLLYFLHGATETADTLRRSAIEGELRRRKYLQTQDLVKIFALTLQSEVTWARLVAILSCCKAVFQLDPILRNDISFSFELCYTLERAGVFQYLEAPIVNREKVVSDFVPLVRASDLDTAFLSLLAELNGYDRHHQSRSIASRADHVFSPALTPVARGENTCVYYCLVEFGHRKYSLVVFNTFRQLIYCALSFLSYGFKLALADLKSWPGPTTGDL